MPILCLYFWGPAGMTGNNFKEKKVVPLIFMQFWSRRHFSKLDWLTPQTSLGFLQFNLSCENTFFFLKDWSEYSPDNSILAWQACKKYFALQKIYIGNLCHFSIKLTVLLKSNLAYEYTSNVSNFTFVRNRDLADK